VSLPVTGSQIGPLHFGPPVHFFSHFVPQEPLLQLLQSVKLPESLLHVPLAQFVGSLQAFSHEFPQKPSAQEVQLCNCPFEREQVCARQFAFGF
jgi:hypothetical protein